MPRRGLGAITNGSPASRELATETPSWSPVGAVGAHRAERERRARARILRSAPICSLVRNAGSFFPFAKCRAGVYCAACTWVIDPLIGSHHGDATAVPSASHFPPAAPAARLTTPGTRAAAPASRTSHQTGPHTLPTAPGAAGYGRRRVIWRQRFGHQESWARQFSLRWNGK